LLRTVPSDSLQSSALTTLVLSYNWNYTAIITSSSSYAQGISAALASQQASKGLTVLTVQTFQAGETNPDNLTSQMAAIISSGATIILVCASGNEIVTVMTAAAQNQLTGAGYAWISADPSNIASTNLSNVQGLISLNPKSGTGLLYESLEISWAMKDPVLYPGQVHSQTQGSIPDPGRYSAQTFDAVYAFAW
jgi:ABC-type branched-subunit amino acid transport system substrate-binding protein